MGKHAHVLLGCIHVAVSFILLCYVCLFSSQFQTRFPTGTESTNQLAGCASQHDAQLRCGRRERRLLYKLLQPYGVSSEKHLALAYLLFKCFAELMEVN